MKVLLVGTGYMAREYFKYLINNDIDTTVVGRSNNSTKEFTNIYGCKAYDGGLENFLQKNITKFDCAIIATSIESLSSNILSCLNHNIEKLLVEKPGFLNLDEIKKIISNHNTSQVYIAYNRRFFSSVIKLKKLIKNEAIVGLDFDFSEWMFKINKNDYSNEVLKKWSWVNSSHVIDLAFHLIGKPSKLHAYYNNRSVFYQNYSGGGLSDTDIIFSYKAHWNSASRWSLNIFTEDNQYILKPIEDLSYIPRGAIDKISIQLSKKLDIEYKPGLASMLEDFFGKCNYQKTLKEQIEFFNTVEIISPSTHN